jgi:transposase-like protein
VTSDKAGPYLRVLADLVPAAAHVTEHANNRIEADHGRLKARLRPMRGFKRFRSASRIAAGHAFVQNLRRRPLRARHRTPGHPCVLRRPSPCSPWPCDLRFFQTRRLPRSRWTQL